MLYEAYHFGACFGFWCTSSYDVLLHAYIFSFAMSFVVLTISKNVLLCCTSPLPAQRDPRRNSHREAPCTIESMIPFLHCSHFVFFKKLSYASSSSCGPHSCSMVFLDHACMYCRHVRKRDSDFRKRDNDFKNVTVISENVTVISKT